jgi:hypothetical protein
MEKSGFVLLHDKVSFLVAQLSSFSGLFRDGHSLIIGLSSAESKKDFGGI